MKLSKLIHMYALEGCGILIGVLSYLYQDNVKYRYGIIITSLTLIYAIRKY